MKKNIILGGSFDPVHTGHITIADKTRSIIGADKVFFIPTIQNPLKQQSIASIHDRVEMLKLATQHLSWASVIHEQIRLSSERSPFTIDTIEELFNKGVIKDPPYLLIGDDIVNHLQNWKRIDDLITKITLLIVSRSYSKNTEVCSYPHIFVKIPLLNISSSTIRLKIKEKKDPENLSPEVWKYIKKNKLYH